MGRLILRRLAIYPVVLIFANFFGFAYAYYLGPIQAVRNPYSIGGIQIPPLFPAYLAYLKAALAFDFGVMPQGEPIATAVMKASAASLGLLGLAILASVLVGLPLGIRAVRVSPPKVSGWLTAMVTLGLATPSYYIGILLIAFSVIYVIWGPGKVPVFPFQGFGWDAHLVLPTLALMVLPMVRIAQISSGMLFGEMGKQYVVAARSFGNTVQTVRRRHAFRNILAAVVITIAASLRLMVAELIIVERLFDWPGFGRLFSSTIILTSRTDNFLFPPLVAALMTVLAAFFLLIDLFSAVFVRVFDPRQAQA